MIYNLFIDSSFNRFMLYLFENGKCIYFDGLYLNDIKDINERRLAYLYAKRLVYILKDKDVSILNVKFIGGSIIKSEFLSYITCIFKVKKIEDITPVKRGDYLSLGKRKSNFLF